MSEKTVQIVEVILAIIAVLKGIDTLHDRHRKPIYPQTRQEQPWQRVPDVERPRRLPPVEPEFPIPVTPFNPRGW